MESMRADLDPAASRGAHRLLAFYGELGQRSAVHGVAPRDPDGEERLAVWRRRP